MHQYMKSIGFGNIRDKKQLTQILKDVEESYTQHQLVTQDETTDLCEFEKEYMFSLFLFIAFPPSCHGSVPVSFPAVLLHS